MIAGFLNHQPFHSPTGSDRKKVGTKVSKVSPVKKSKLKSSPTDPKKRKAVLKPRDAVESDADDAGSGASSPPEPKVTKRKGKKLRKEALKPKMQDDFFGNSNMFCHVILLLLRFCVLFVLFFLLLELNLVGVVGVVLLFWALGGKNGWSKGNTF